MRVVNVVVAVAALSVLGGCMTAQEQQAAAYARPYVPPPAGPRTAACPSGSCTVAQVGPAGVGPAVPLAPAVAQVDPDDATCRSYGTKPGSDAYVACRMNLANNREARERADAAEARAAEANRNANQQRAWEALTQQGIQMMQGRPTVSCTTTGTSMMRTTNCY